MSSNSTAEWLAMYRQRCKGAKNSARQDFRHTARHVPPFLTRPTPFQPYILGASRVLPYCSCRLSFLTFCSLLLLEHVSRYHARLIFGARGSRGPSGPAPCEARSGGESHPGRDAGSHGRLCRRDRPVMESAICALVSLALQGESPFSVLIWLPSANPVRCWSSHSMNLDTPSLPAVLAGKSSRSHLIPMRAE